MKTFALFISILAGYLAARNIKDTDAPGFTQAVRDSISDIEAQVSDTIQAVDYSISAAGSRLPLQIGIVPEVENKPEKAAGFGTRFDSLIISAANANGIPSDVLYRLLNQESRFREDIISGAVKSSAGAIGIAQFMPATAREWLGSEAAALVPQKAIPGAARYLAWLRRQFNGDLVKAVAAYNWGIGNVKRRGLDKAPSETRNYVAAILPGNSIG